MNQRELNEQQSQYRREYLNQDQREESKYDGQSTRQLDVRQLSLNEIIMSYQQQANNTEQTDTSVISRPEESEHGLENTSEIQENDTSIENSIVSYDAAKINVCDQSRVINQELVSDDIKCHICHGILINPMECNKCENCFCINCLQKWLKEAGQCPFKCVGDPDFKLKPHKIIRNLLSQLKLKCRNHEVGCPQILNYDKLEIHEEVECQYELFDCPQKEYGCKELLQRDQIDRHLKEQCKYSKVECMYCNHKFLRSEIRNHLQSCEEAELTCQHCKGQFAKKNFLIHQNSLCEENFMTCGRCQASFKRKYKDFHDCVRHLQNQQKTMQEQIKVLIRENEKKDQKIDQMSSTFSNQILDLHSKLNELAINNSYAVGANPKFKKKSRTPTRRRERDSSANQ